MADTKADDEDGGQTYMLRGIDDDDWRKARIRAINEDRKMSELIRAFIHDYAAGRPAPTRYERLGGKKRRKK
jgi:hypothetical protein